MKLSRRVLFAAAAVAMMATSAPAMADLKFGVAAEPYPPFSSKDASGKWVGWEIDLMDAVCAELKEKCEVAEVAWDGIIPALQAKQFDLIWSSMSITEERKKTIDFSNKYMNVPPTIAGPSSRTRRTVMEFVWITGMLVFAAAAILLIFAFVRVKQRDRHYYETGELED